MFAQLDNRLQTVTSLLTLGVVAGVGYYGYKFIKAADKMADDVTGNIADTYVEITNPIVGAQLKIRPQYFIDINVEPPKLNPEALNVIQSGYPVLFGKVFEPDGTIKNQYLYVIGDDNHYSDTKLP